MTETEDLMSAVERALEEGREPDEMESEIWARFGRTCAVLVLDSLGFSRTTQRRGVVYYLSLITRFRTVCIEVLQGIGALGWRFEADNMYAQFPTPDAALAFAFDIHRRLRKQGLRLDENTPFEVCIGIGYGRLLESGKEGMFGDEMNLASKLGEDAAGGGETLLTEEAWLNLQNQQGTHAQRRLVRVSGVDLPYFSVSPE